MAKTKIIKETVLILRTCAADMSSHGGFVWPESGPVECPDWKATAACGHGLHGFLWGAGNGSLASFEADAKWLVCEVNEYIDLDGKVKFPRATVLHTGDRKSATEFLMAGRSLAGVVGAYVSVGDGQQALGGSRATVTGGDGATVTGGDGATVTGGDGATVTGGEEASFVLTWWNGKRYRRVTAYVGEDGIEPDVAYKLNDRGEIIRRDAVATKVAAPGPVKE